MTGRRPDHGLVARCGRTTTKSGKPFTSDGLATHQAQCAHCLVILEARLDALQSDGGVDEPEAEIDAVAFELPDDLA